MARRNRREGRRRRERGRRPRESGFSLGMLLAINIIPIFAGAAIAVAYYTGSIPFREVPRWTWWLGGGVFAGVFLLSILCWVFVPLLELGAEAAHDSIRRTLRAMREGGALGWVLRLPVLGMKGLVFAIFWSQTVLVTALIVLNVLVVFALVGVLIYQGFMIRSKDPGASAGAAVNTEVTAAVR